MLAAFVAVVSWVLAVWAVHRSLLRWPQGHLHWDGKCWSLVQGGGSSAVLVSLRVIADMQQLLVLRLECQQGRSCHVLLEKNGRLSAGWICGVRYIHQLICRNPTNSQGLHNHFCTVRHDALCERTSLS